MTIVELSDAAAKHLGEVMRGETDGVDANGGCIYCGEILRAVERAGETHPVQRDVHDFFQALGLTVGETPAIRNPQMNADLILEEARETAEAITGRPVYIEFGAGEPERQQSLVGAIDGLCDQLATIYGAAITFGVDLAPFWDEVHRTNMAKAGGPKREDGKQLKPPGWQPPDIEGLLAQLYLAERVSELPVEHRWEIRSALGHHSAKLVEEIPPERGEVLADTMAPVEHLGSVLGCVVPWTFSAFTQRGLERKIERYERRHSFVGQRVPIPAHALMGQR